MNNIQLENDTIQPSKVVCIGRNYAAHVAELNNAMPDQAVIFVKPNSAISNEIVLHGEDEIHYEGELSFVIKDNQLSAVGFGLDLTKRAVQSSLKDKSLPWERAKAFDGSAIFSAFKTLSHSVAQLRLELWINDKLTQSGGCELMLFKPDVILHDIRSFMSLEDGDVIMTGTPAGVGKIHYGDSFVGKVFAEDTLIVEQHWLVK